MKNSRPFRSAAFSLRYGRYRLFFFLGLSLFLLSAVAGWLLWRGTYQSITLFSVERASVFSGYFTVELLFLTLVFLFGITLYAPVTFFLSALFRGVFSGVILSGLFDAATGNGIWVFVLTLLFFLLSASLFFSYASFCTLVALRLFTDLPMEGGEKTVFGGSLFRSSYFCSAINLRFLSMYLLFFLTALLLSSGISFLYALLRSLLI